MFCADVGQTYEMKLKRLKEANNDTDEQLLRVLAFD